MHISELQHRIASLEDQKAYKELFERYYKRLLQFSYSITHHKPAAEDVVTDVFVRIWVKRKTLDHIDNLNLYLYVSVRNYSLNYLRDQKKHSALQLEEMRVELEQLVANPQDLMIGHELQHKLAEVVNSLPAQCKIIYKLINEDGLKQKEVAELLHLQPKTVENQLAIAIKKIGLVVEEVRLRRKQPIR